MRKKILPASLLLVPAVAAWAAGGEKYNDCTEAGLTICERAGHCSVESSSWYQHAIIDKSDAYAVQEWTALCDLVHSRLAQGDCAPYGAQDYVTAYLSATSSVLIPQISGIQACGRVNLHAHP
ncbi:MAG: hypothetical protein AB1810_04455 [Pseudomonadota bacterium]